MMVRERGRCVRQLSLEGPVRGPLRRQASEDLRPGPLKIAWAVEPQPEPGVEVVAKKCGQPKPSMNKPPRSPFLPDQSSVLFSRQQLSDRLRSSWKKKNGRHNLKIFLNQSVDSDTDYERPRTPSSEESDTSPEPPPPPPEREKMCASDRRMNFRNTGRQKVIESPCPTPTPEPRKPLQRMMSAPVRAPAKKITRAPSVESQTSQSSQRIKSAPPKRKLKPPSRRKVKEEDEKGTKKGIRRGVERGEVVTMVSLVSPAESDSDEPLCILPPSPNPTPPPPSPKQEPKPPPPPPPPIICIRKPPKAVSFRPAGLIQTNGTQFQTNYTLKRTVVRQSSTPSPQPRPPFTRQNTVTSRVPNVHIAQNSSSSSNSSVEESTKDVDEKDENAQKPRLVHQVTVIRRKPATVVPPMIQPIVKIESKQKSADVKEEPEAPIEVKPSAAPLETSEEVTEEKPTVPDFKSKKERECWELFKKMSNSGVSVSFETVLRGLLTPTEYRMRKAALLSVC